MRDNSTNSIETPTRRGTINYGGAVVGGGLLAGYTGDAVADESGNSTNLSDASAPDNDRYTVSMEPVGDVTFDRVPERWVAYDGGYADMAIALGQADGLAGLGSADRYYTHVYDEIPGAEVDLSTLEDYPEVRTNEEFYELDCDVHLYDLQMVINWFDWSDDDVDEIAACRGQIWKSESRVAA